MLTVEEKEHLISALRGKDASKENIMRCFLNSSHGFVMLRKGEWEKGQELIIHMISQASL